LSAALSNAQRQRNFRERRALYSDQGVAVASLVRAAIATGRAKIDNTIKPLEFARQQWDDSRVELVLRAAVNPTALSNTPALTQISFAFLRALAPMSAGADLLARGIELSFGCAASIMVPGIAIPVAGFVGEGKPIPVVSAPTSAGATLLPHNVKAIAVLTNEMLRSSNAETLVRDALIQSTGPALDQVLFSANAATSDAPAGILNGIAPLTPAAAGPIKGEILVDDLQKLATAIGPVSGNGGIVLVASPDAAAALVMRLPASVEWPVFTSASLSARTVICIAAAAVASAVEGVPQIEAGSYPALHFDTQPSEAVDIGGVMARPMYSTYQSDEVALRLRWPISWALRTSAGLAWMNNVNW